MQFDTKVALVIRHDLEAWQKLNVAAFLASGIAAAFPECVGEPYADKSGTRYHALIDRFRAGHNSMKIPHMIKIPPQKTPGIRAAFR